VATVIGAGGDKLGRSSGRSLHRPHRPLHMGVDAGWMAVPPFCLQDRGPMRGLFGPKNTPNPQIGSSGVIRAGIAYLLELLSKLQRGCRRLPSAHGRPLPNALNLLQQERECVRRDGLFLYFLYCKKCFWLTQSHIWNC
jgi:hypothetical protein